LLEILSSAAIRPQTERILSLALIPQLKYTFSPGMHSVSPATDGKGIAAASAKKSIYPVPFIHCFALFIAL
jgi:hypothetical protein